MEFTVTEEQEMLADERKAGRTHYVDDDCELRVLGTCVRRRYVYCSYKSKIGRVLGNVSRKQPSAQV